MPSLALTASPVLLALVASAAYGSADFAGGLAARRMHVLRVVAVAAPAGLVTCLVLLPVGGARWSSQALAWGAASGVASAAAFGLLYLTLSLGPMSVLSPVSAVVSAVIPATVGLAEGERLDPPLLAGLGLSLVAILLLGGGTHRAGSGPSRRALVLAIGAGAAIAGQLICLHQAPADSRLAPLVVGSAVSCALLVGAALLAGVAGPPYRAARLAVSSGVLSAVGNLTFLLAVQSGDLAVVAIITALYPATTVVLARFSLGERIRAGQGAGLLAAGAGVCLLAVR